MFVRGETVSRSSLFAAAAQRRRMKRKWRRERREESRDTKDDEQRGEDFSEFPSDTEVQTAYKEGLENVSQPVPNSTDCQTKGNVATILRMH